MNKYFAAFKEKITWFNPKKEPIEIYEIEDFELTPRFKELFPIATELINASIKTGIEFKGKSMILFTWEQGNEICGWLSQFEQPKIELLPEHQIWMDNIGGIIQSFSGPESIELKGINYNRTLTLNQDVMFVGSMNANEVDWAPYYYESCAALNIEPIDLSSKVAFTREGNGDAYLYDRNTKEVLLFAADHDFRFVERIPNQPERTMYTVKGVKVFQDFVELLSKQWAIHLK